MIPEIAVTVGAYLIASGVAVALHELAHYVVHRRHAQSVSVGINWYGPYVDSAYAPSAPTFPMCIGSIAPTLFYTPLVVLGSASYLSQYPLPQLDPVGWSLVLTPLLVLITPSGADIESFRRAFNNRA